MRQKVIYDGAVPSANSVAMLNLIRLARITANSDFENKALKIVQSFSSNIKNSPLAHTQLMAALDFIFGPSYELVIAGKQHSPDTRQMLKALRTHFIPNKVVIFHPTGQGPSDIERIAEFTKYQTSIEGRATAYVCLNHSCKSPTTDIARMLEMLGVK